MKEYVHSHASVKSRSHRSSSSCSHSARSSRRHSESKCRKKRSERKSYHGHEKSSALHRLRKRVSHMVHKDRKHKEPDQLQPEAVTTCGCPNDCAAELRKLRDYVNSFQPLLSNDGDLPTLYQLDHFATSPVSLLSEAWVTLGPSHLRDLVSSELLAICSRREQRDRDQCLSNRDEKDRAKEYMNTPPFLSLEAENSCVITAGVKELWKRSLRELNDLSESEIKAILSGTHGDLSESPAKVANANHAFDEPDKINNSSNWPCVSNENFELSKSLNPHSESKTLNKNSPQNAPGSACMNQEVQTATSPERPTGTNGNPSATNKKSNQVNDIDPATARLMVQQEITELELRARAIRSMLKAGTNSNSL